MGPLVMIHVNIKRGLPITNLTRQFATTLIREESNKVIRQRKIFISNNFGFWWEPLSLFVLGLIWLKAFLTKN